jgi:peptide/nickel transport system permease protein
MSRYILRRILHAIVVLLVITLLTFLLLHMGGDPASLMASEYFSDADVAELRGKLGLDQPLYVQYVKFLFALVRGDVGTSFMQHRPAMEIVLEKLPATLELAGTAFVATLGIAIPLGVLAAVKRGSLWDRAGLSFALSGQALPSFWFGIMLIILFSLFLGWLPSFGGGTWQQLVMPAATLAIGYTGILTRVVRSAMLDVLGQDYMVTAHAKGLAPLMVLFRHALRNAALPSVTVIGLELGGLLSGSIVVETVFAYPGMGWLAIQAINAKDFPVVLCFVVLLAVVTLAITLSVDICYAVLDPRIAYS